MGSFMKRRDKNILSPLDKEQKQASNEQIESKANQLSRENEELVDHLTELRKQLIKSMVVFLAFILIVFITMDKWFPVVTKGNELVVFGPFQIVKFYTSICVTLALGLSLPFLTHFLWQFLKPGLKDDEIRFLGLYSPVMFLLFIGGVAFGYFIVNPLSYQFLMGFGAVNFDVIVSAQEYIHFLMMTTVPLGFLFELPVIAMFLSSIGILTSDTMKTARKYSYLVIAVLSALITPPDFISQLIVLIPMVLLYETSIFIVKKMESRQAAQQEKALVSE